MKKRMLDYLVCPVDGTELELRTWQTVTRTLSAEDTSRAERLGIDTASLSEEVLEGALLNTQRKLLYPIFRGVPRMLTFQTGVTDAFWDQYRERINRELPGYSLPRLESMPGEADVLRTFSSEWVNYDWDGKAYWNLTPDAWFKCMQFALNLKEYPVEDKLTLEVGIGIGGVADFMARQEKCETVGMDLGEAVDAAFAHFGENPFLHIVQASAFAPPFRAKSFDFVCSFGVIHHTFSTKTAFDSVCKLPRHGGRLYVWVYSPYNESRTLVRRGLMKVEQSLRPIISRLPERAQAVALAPLVPLYMAYQWVRASRQPAQSHVKYGLREAFHAARDRLTPHYIHRHDDEEVCSWFRDAGYSDLECDSQRPRPHFVPIAFTANTGVSGIRE